MAGGNGEALIVGGVARIARQREVGMPREIDGRRRVGGRFVRERQRVLENAEERGDVEIAGKAIDAGR